jgi:hypothetical protein
MSPLLPCSTEMAASVWAYHKALLGRHTASFDDRIIIAAGKFGETQTDDLLRPQTRLPRIK